MNGTLERRKMDNEIVENVEQTDKGPAFGVRHTITIFLCFLVAIAYGMRVNLSVAIVAMTDNTTTKNPDIPVHLFGTIIATLVTGYISASWTGWPPTFYLFGVVGYLWLVAWAIFGANNPAEHKKITKEERIYVQGSLGTNEHTQIAPTPWMAIFTSLPVWAIVIGTVGQNWGASTLLTEMPNYINKIMKFDMKSNGLLSAAPYTAVFVCSCLFGPISDYMINNGYGSRGTVRKLFNTIGTFVPAAALLTLGFLPEDATGLSVAMLIIAVGINAAICCGFQVNHIDLSPKFSGILMGIGNGSSNVFSIVAPLVVQVVVTDETNKDLWKTIFIIASIVYVATDIFFVIFASGSIQWWDSTESEKDDNDYNHTIIA